jgi:hypothetical protein
MIQSRFEEVFMRAWRVNADFSHALLELPEQAPPVPIGTSSSGREDVIMP